MRSTSSVCRNLKDVHFLKPYFANFSEYDISVCQKGFLVRVFLIHVHTIESDKYTKAFNWGSVCSSGFVVVFLTQT